MTKTPPSAHSYRTVAAKSCSVETVCNTTQKKQSATKALETSVKLLCCESIDLKRGQDPLGCPNCGASTEREGQKFCALCGARISKFDNPFEIKQGIGRIIAALVLVCLITATIASRMETKPPKLTTDAIRAELDPPASRPLTPKESLAKAKDFLHQLQAGIDQQKADVLIQLISDYSSAAEADSKLRPQAKELMNQMAKKVIEIEKLRGWDSITTLTVAEAMCQNSISASLKAPSTAEWHRPESGKWRDHPGFFPGHVYCRCPK